MKLTIEATDQVTSLDGVLARVWHGTTEAGTPCLVFVHRVAVRDDKDQAEFQRELAEQLPPGRTVSLRQVL